MNSLNRNLKAGDKVFIDGRTFVCGGQCFGSMSFTTGTALDGRFEGEETATRREGYEIDVAATMERHAAENGWDVPAPAGGA